MSGTRWRRLRVVHLPLLCFVPVGPHSLKTIESLISEAEYVLMEVSRGQTLGKELYCPKKDSTHVIPNSNYDLIQKATEGRIFGLFVDLCTFYDEAQLKEKCRKFPKLYHQAMVGTTTSSDRLGSHPKFYLKGFFVVD